MNTSTHFTFDTYRGAIRDSLRLKSPVAEIFYTAYSIISLIGITGNALVCWIVCSKPGMRTPRNILIANLSTASFLISATLIPFLCVPDVNVAWFYGDFMCAFNRLFSSVNSYCISFTISAISIDRYVVVRRTGNESRRLDKRRHALFLSIFIWVVALAVSIPHVPFFINKKYSGPKSLGFENRTVLSICTVVDSVKIKVWILIQLSLIQYIFPLVFVGFFNYKLHQFLKQRHSKRLMLKSTTDQIERPVAVTPSDLRTQATLIRSWWWKCQHPRSWSKTSALLFAMAASYATFWAPFIMVQFMDTFQQITGSNVALFRYIDLTMKLVGNISVCVNPFLYGYLNTNFRRAFADLFCLSVFRRHHEIGVENGDIERSYSLNYIPELINSPLTAILRMRRTSSIVDIAPTDSAVSNDPFSPEHDVFL